MPSFPPPPSRGALPGQSPPKEGGPLSVVLAPSPMVGGMWCSGATRIAAPVWVPRSLGARGKHPLPISSPHCGPVLLF